MNIIYLLKWVWIENNDSKLNTNMFNKNFNVQKGKPKSQAILKQNKGAMTFDLKTNVQSSAFVNIFFLKFNTNVLYTEIIRPSMEQCSALPSTFLNASVHHDEVGFAVSYNAKLEINN